MSLSEGLSPFARVLHACKKPLRSLKNVPVTYDVDDFQLEAIPARKGTTPFRVDTGDAFNMLIRSTDFIIEKRFLRHPDTDELFEPIPGHRISYVRQGIKYTCEVLEYNGEDAARPSDSTDSEYRIHTKEVDKELAE